MEAQRRRDAALEGCQVAGSHYGRACECDAEAAPADHAATGSHAGKNLPDWVLDWVTFVEDADHVAPSTQDDEETQGVPQEVSQAPWSPPQSVPELAREDPSLGPRGRTRIWRQGLPCCHIVERRGGICGAASKRSIVVLGAINDESGNLCVACAPTLGLADSAQVTSFYESSALPLVATDGGHEEHRGHVARGRRRPLAVTGEE